MNEIVYLDSSAIVKRYVVEPGSDVISKVYSKVLIGDLLLSFSIWNIGEVLGVLDKYHRRGWLSVEDYRIARTQFIGETIKLLKLGLLKIVPVKSKIIAETWLLIEKHHLYEADALQIISAKDVKAKQFYTADRKLHSIAVYEGLESIYLGK